ncbi:MAG: FHA domain-containing protein [Ktedonobacterales bacterium]
MARFAYGASHATAALGVFGASGLGNSVAVGAAALVVVVTIVLVFVMVLRSNGASKRTASGLGYDAQQGPIGQPRPEDGANASSWQRQAMPQGDMAGAGPMGQMSAPSAGRVPGGAGAWGQTQDYGGGALGAGAPASQGGWGAGGAAGPSGWDAPVAPGQANPQSGANPWGIGGNSAPAQADQWGQRGGWDAAANTPSRPAANASGWDAPASQGPSAGAAGGFGGGWGAPGGQSAPAANAAAPQWGAADAGSSWGAPAQAAPAPANAGGWGASAPNAMGAGMGQPQPASGANWGAEWGAPAQATPSPAAMPPGMPQGYGDVDKTRVVRPAAGAQGQGMLVVRQGKEPGRIFEVRKDRLTIGRSRESDIFLEDLAVSRLHTTVSRDEYGRYILRDENSANGTYVNGQRVSEHVLEEGDEIQVGQSVLAFVRR